MFDDEIVKDYCSSPLDTQQMFEVFLPRSITWKDFRCAICKEYYQTPHTLSTHVKTHQKEKILNCDQCDFQCLLGEELLDHRYIHSKDPPFRCIFCQNRFINPDGLMTHLCKLYTDNTRCNRCTNEFESFTVQSWHIRICLSLKPFGCEFCSRHFDSIGELVLHTNNELGNRNLKCEICNKFFRTTNGLESHKKRKRHDNPLECIQCGKKLADKTDLIIHKMKHEKRLNKKPIRCSHCDKEFRYKNNLRDHMNRINGIKPYGCKHCGKKFPVKQDLTHHLMKEEGTEPHRCIICKEGFIRKGRLQQHELTHSRSL